MLSDGCLLNVPATCRYIPGTDLLLLQRSTAVQVISSVRLMPQNQPSGRSLLPCPTAWSPDQHHAAMLADVSWHILGRTEGRGLGCGQPVRTHTGKCLKCQSSSDGGCAQAEDSSWARSSLQTGSRCAWDCWARSSLQTGSRCAWDCWARSSLQTGSRCAWDCWARSSLKTVSRCAWDGSAHTAARAVLFRGCGSNFISHPVAVC